MLSKLRRQYHGQICEKIVRITRKKGTASYPNNADGSNKASREIAWAILEQIGCSPLAGNISGQTAGNRFEQVTVAYLKKAFDGLRSFRPGKWIYSISTPISKFDQYKDLARIEDIVKNHRELATTLGKDYVISPDIVIAREPISDSELNKETPLLEQSDAVATLTPFRAQNSADPRPILHASISCKWTLRSDRSQNTRTEALNLIRNRKGKLPHIVAITAEPTPIRIASLALGTGDIDCVYHFALPELKAGLDDLGNADQAEMLNMLIGGRRLRDISDLPFDLAT